MRATAISRDPLSRAAAGDRPRDLLVAGHINVDRFLRVTEFPPADRTVPILASRSELGGTAANIALTATRYGVACGLVARVGDGFTPAMEAPLRRARIDLRGVVHTPGRATPTCFIVEDSRGAQRTLIDQGPMADRPVLPFRVPTGMEEYSWLHVTTGPPSVHLRLVDAARARGLRVAADPAQEIHYRWNATLLRRLLAASELFFGNRSEVDRVLELMGLSSPTALLEYVPLVIRTEGAKGATAFSRRGTVRVAARRPKRRRTIVGAGDAFRGGFYAGWFEGAPLVGCLEAGSRAAARWIEGAR
ncbi:MAG TPA: PfkB family carbohydrate kinase [Thermoplasmata archaeon]|nr:PfkB family carbohydrate kinase [Thermoplasmata archaeon]